MSGLPILSTLEKKIILVLGSDYDEFTELSRFAGRDIKEYLNEFNEIYNTPFQSSIPYSTLKHLEEKKLVDTVMDTINGRKVKYYLLTRKGIE